MRKFLNLVLIFLLSSFFVFTPCVAYASGSNSVEVCDSTILEEANPNWLISCIHDGRLICENIDPYTIKVTVINVVTETLFYKCTDVMSYTLYYEFWSNGKLFNSGTHTGAVGNYEDGCKESWSFGATYGQTLKLKLVTNVHHQTVTKDWIEVKFY